MSTVYSEASEKFHGIRVQRDGALLRIEAPWRARAAVLVLFLFPFALTAVLAYVLPELRQRGALAEITLRSETGVFCIALGAVAVVAWYVFVAATLNRTRIEIDSEQLRAYAGPIPGFTRRRVAQLKDVYNVECGVHHVHRRFLLVHSIVVVLRDGRRWVLLNYLREPEAARFVRQILVAELDRHRTESVDDDGAT